MGRSKQRKKDTDEEKKLRKAEGNRGSQKGGKKLCRNEKEKQKQTQKEEKNGKGMKIQRKNERRNR